MFAGEAGEGEGGEEETTGGTSTGTSRFLALEFNSQNTQQAASITHDMFAGEAGEGEEELTGGYFYFYRSG